MTELLSQPALKLVAQVVLTVWMVAVAWRDHRTGRIANSYTAPVFLAVGAWRLYEGVTGEPALLLLFVVWALLFLMWMVHVIGGGGAKFLMALYALFPSMEFTTVLALILLVITVPLLLWEFRGRPVRQTLGNAWRRLATGQLLPSQQELSERGRPYAWTFALPAVLYTWFYW